MQTFGVLPIMPERTGGYWGYIIYQQIWEVQSISFILFSSPPPKKKWKWIEKLLSKLIKGVLREFTDKIEDLEDSLFVTFTFETNLTHKKLIFFLLT